MIRKRLVVSGLALLLGYTAFAVLDGRTSLPAVNSGYSRVTYEKPTRFGSLRQELEIGIDDGRVEYVFGRIHDVAVGRDGRIAVVDGMIPAVRVFNSAGNHLYDVGGIGDGPGEFRRIGSVLLLANGRVTVCTDRGVMFYSDSGVYIGHFHIPLADGYCDLRERTDGGLIVAAETPRWRKTYYVNAEGVVHDSVRTPDAQIVGVGVSEGFRYVYSPMIMSRWTPEGSFVSLWSAKFEIEVNRRPTNADGGMDHMELIELVVDPVPLAADERHQLVTVLARMRSRRSGPNEASAEEFVASVKPAIQGLWIGQTGLIWLRGSTKSISAADSLQIYRTGIVEGWGEAGVLYTIPLRGSSIGVVYPQVALIPHDARGDTIWGSYESKIGTPRVGRFVVKWTAADSP